MKSTYAEFDSSLTLQPASDDYPTLTLLGNPVVGPRNEMEFFPNPAPGKNFTVELHSEEFTCLCPITGQPDFAEIKVFYAPKDFIVESKSFKMFLWHYRDMGAFHEAIINQIADHFMERAQPYWVEVTGIFNPRGGIGITVTAARGGAFEYLPED